MINLILAAILAAVLSGAGGVWYGMGLGRDHLLAEQAMVATVIRETRDEARMGAADAIAAGMPKNVTIRQTLEREVREKTVFADCRSGDFAVRMLNATSGITASAVAPGGGELRASEPSH